MPFSSCFFIMDDVLVMLLNSVKAYGGYVCCAHVSPVIYTPNLVQYEQTCFTDLFLHFLLFHMLYFF